MSRVFKLSYILLILLFSESVLAEENWRVGAGVGFIGNNFTSSGTVNGVCCFENAQRRGGVIGEVYLVNYNYINLAIVGGIVQVTEGIDVGVGSTYTKYYMSELGVEYNLFHSLNNWFIDIGYRRGFSLGGPVERLNYTTSIDYQSGLANGYNKFDIGIGKSFERLVVRLALSLTSGIEGPTFYDVNTGLQVASDVTSESFTRGQLTITYWW